MNPKGMLREEHGNIMKMLAVFQRLFAILADLKEGETKDLKTLIEFFEIYVDRYHHGKEEQVLFPVLSRARIAKIGSLISSLIDDHRQARMGMEVLKFNVVTLRSCSGTDRNECSERAQLYVDLLRRHIRRENSELLPLIEERLSATERLQIARQFHDLENETLGASGLETLLASVHGLSQKYSLQST